MIKLSAKVTDKRNKAFDDFVNRFKNRKSQYVSIGFHEGAGTYQDGQSVINVALWNEFGTENIPERSFIRSAIDENTDKINGWRLEVIQAMMFQNMTPKKALETLGFRVQQLIQNKIKSNVPPPNDEATIKRKQAKGVAPVTLIDTGLMLRSVTYKVHE